MPRTVKVLARFALFALAAGLFASTAFASSDMYLMFSNMGRNGMPPGIGPRPGPGPDPDFDHGARHGPGGRGMMGGWINVESFKWGDAKGKAISGSKATDIMPAGPGPGSLTVRLNDDGRSAFLEQYCGADVPMPYVSVQSAGPRAGNTMIAYALRHVTIKCKGSSGRELTLIYETADLPSPAGLKPR